MATVLQLLPPPRLISPTVGGRTAEIIIFPGVRYERVAAVPTKATKTTRKRRTRVKRDHLVITG